MSLVQYESSDESSDEVESSHIEKVSTIHTQSTNQPSSFSISSFLPPPKNEDTSVESKSQVLGKAIKNTVNAMIAHNVDGIVLPKSDRKITSFIPSSVRNKVKTSAVDKNQEVRSSINNTNTNKQETKPETRKAIMNLFNEVKPKNRGGLVHNETIGIRSFESDYDMEEAEKNEPQLEPKQEKSEDIKEFNMDDFYTENIELKAKGQLQENKRLFSVTNSKNQLSSLIKNARQNEDLLNEKFERNKKIRKERENRYGF